VIVTKLKFYALADGLKGGKTLADGRIILRWVVKKGLGGYGLDLTLEGTGQRFV
jgi:hypothetical protein